MSLGGAFRIAHGAEVGHATPGTAAQSTAEVSADATKAAGLRAGAENQPRDHGRACNQLIRFHVRISR
jgi:hypothetical protein